MGKKRVAIVAAGFLVLVALGGGLYWQQSKKAGGTTAASDGVWRTNQEAAFQEAKERGVPIMVDFFATWCDPCVAMDREVFSTDAFKAKAKQWVFLRMDVTDQTPEAGTLMDKYDVTGLPALRFLSPEGKQLPEYSIDGLVDPVSIYGMMERVELAHRKAP